MLPCWASIQTCRPSIYFHPITKPPIVLHPCQEWYSTSLSTLSRQSSFRNEKRNVSLLNLATSPQPQIEVAFFINPPDRLTSYSWMFAWDWPQDLVLLLPTNDSVVLVSCYFSHWDPVTAPIDGNSSQVFAWRSDRSELRVRNVESNLTWSSWRLYSTYSHISLRVYD